MTTSKTREFLDNLTHAQLLDRLNLALDGGGLGIWDWDLRDGSVAFDRRWCDMLGLDHTRVAQTYETWSTRVHPDDLARAQEDITATLEGKCPQYQNVHRMQHVAGHWLYILARGRISGRDADDRPIRFTGTHFDVTETELGRRVLAQERRALEDLIGAVPLGVAMFDRGLRLVTASPRWLRDHDLDPRAVLGAPIAVTAPAIAARWGAALTAAVAGERQRADEDPVTDGDRARWLRWETRPWFDAAGQINGALLCTEDITEQVERRREAEDAREGRLASLAIFAGGIAHELNTPLQVISLEAEMMRRELNKPTPSPIALRESAVAISAIVERASAITHALRTLARDARRDPAGPVSIASLLADADALCRSRFESGSVAFTIEDHSDGAAVLGRTAELLVVLLNLLNNADHAARTGARWVRLTVAHDGVRARFQCIDGGPGIDPADARQLMEPWFTTKPVGVGTGLGLTIAHTLAVRNGGDLRHRADAPFTTFELDLPLAVAPVAP